MQVEVRLFANLAQFLPPGARGRTTLEVPAGTTVDEVVRRLAIPDDLPRLTLVNGQDPAPGHRLGPGDVVSLLPPLAGG